MLYKIGKAEILKDLAGLVLTDSSFIKKKKGQAILRRPRAHPEGVFRCVFKRSSDEEAFYKDFFSLTTETRSLIILFCSGRSASIFTMSEGVLNDY